LVLEVSVPVVLVQRSLLYTLPVESPWCLSVLVCFHGRCWRCSSDDRGDCKLFIILGSFFIMLA
jgi:hypothetical protein